MTLADSFGRNFETLFKAFCETTSENEVYNKLGINHDLYVLPLYIICIVTLFTGLKINDNMPQLYNEQWYLNPGFKSLMFL